MGRVKAIRSGRWRRRDWCCAGRFTAADISVGYALLLANHLKCFDGAAPSVRGYWERLKARPAFQAAKKAQKADLAEELARS